MSDSYANTHIMKNIEARNGADSGSLLKFEQHSEETILSVLPDKMVKAMDKIPPEYWELSEDELRKQIRVSETLSRVRMNLWFTINRNVQRGLKVKETDLYGGTCHRAFVTTRIYAKPDVLAWVLTPPKDYTRSLNEALSRSFDRVREILEAPLYVDGGLDHKTASLMIKALEIFDKRVNGMAIQRIETKTQTISDRVPKDIETTHAELDDKIKNLESALVGNRNSTTRYDASAILEVIEDDGNGDADE